MRVRSIENRVFTVMANRVGVEGRVGDVLRFTGGSQVVDPTGRGDFKVRIKEVVARSVEIDVSLAKDKTSHV
jgi:predicted amidohydrolase